MPTTNIDDLLMGGGQSPTQKVEPVDAPEVEEELESSTPEHEDAPEYDEPDEQEPEPSEQAKDEPEEPKAAKKEYDDYGNEKEPENKEIRERLKKQAKKYESEIESLRAQLASQGASQKVQQAAKDFEYDPNASGDWQQQLAAVIKQTVRSMNDEDAQERQRYEEAKVQQEFTTKFREGMNKFDDFVDVVDSLPFEISNHMTLATRDMENPAAFLYAAAKREAKELERISKLRDPYAQVREMGKLEERMRRNKQTTTAPRPMGRTQEDSVAPEIKKKREPTIEELIAKSEAKKLAQMKQRSGGRR
jgi:hypothetical protein